MGSQRFPGKPMEKILHKPMIGHVYEQVKKNNLVSYLAVCTCDNEIFDYINLIGGNAVMTSKSHERASDRCAEALIKIEKNNKIEYDIVVMVQGDEPMIHPDMITEAVSPMINNNEIIVTNLLGKISTIDEFEDRNCIKVVCKQNGDALYFSREPIPTRVNDKDISMGKQICVIPFRRDFLLEYNQLSQTPLELAESVDMMRILEHGLNVRMVPTKHISYSVDTKKDLIKVEKLLFKVTA